MPTSFDPAEIDVIEDDYTSNLSSDESENASTRRILGLCEYARGLQKRVQERDLIITTINAGLQGIALYIEGQEKKLGS